LEILYGNSFDYFLKFLPDSAKIHLIFLRAIVYIFTQMRDNYGCEFGNFRGIFPEFFWKNNGTFPE